MGNAPEDLLRMAAALGWQVAPPHDQDGVADAIWPCCPQPWPEAEPAESNGEPELVGL